MPSLFHLIDGSVDYAGLFPPAGLPMETVVSNYAQYSVSSERAMLGRLIIPAMKLPPFEDCLIAIESAPDNLISPWRISALIPSIDEQNPELNFLEFDRAFDAIDHFNRTGHAPKTGHAIVDSSVVDSIEIKTTSLPTTRAIIERTPETLDSFLEIAWQSDPEPLIQCIADNRGGKPVFAKIRTGGIQPALIPSSDEVARFIASCAKHGVGFKATAGLHHPIRAPHRLTYEENAPIAVMHGFLNVFVATVIAFEFQVSQDILVDILNNTQPNNFQFDQDSLSWNDLNVSSERIKEIRKTGIISFGSCSFTEPIQELAELPGNAFASIFSS